MNMSNISIISSSCFLVESMHAHPLVNGYNKRLEMGISSVKNKGDFPSFVAIPEFIDIRDGVFEMRGMDLHGENIVDLVSLLYSIY